MTITIFKKYRAPLVYAISIFIATYVLSTFYVDGDQASYHKFYNGIRDYDLKTGFQTFYPSTLGTKEPGYFLLIYLVSPFFAKNLLMSFFNGLIAFLFVFWCQRVCAKKHLIFLCAFGFYPWVLFVAAERLKFAALLFLLSYTVSYSWQMLFAFSSLLFHAQFLTLVVSKLFMRMGSVIQRRQHRYLIRKKVLYYIPLLFSGLFIAYYAVGHHAYSKAMRYAASYSIGPDLLKLISLGGLAIAFAKNKLEALIYVFPLLVAGSFLGSSRVTILIYFVFAGYALQSNSKIKESIFLLTLIYFAVKTIPFVCNVIIEGHGFSGLSLY